MEPQDIIRQHGNSVAVVFKKNGIKKPVSVDSLLLHTLLKGDEFIQQIGDQVEKDMLYTGIDSSGLYPNNNNSYTPGTGVQREVTLENVTVTAAKSKSSKLKNTLNDILNTVASVLGTYKGARAAATGTAPALPPPVTAGTAIQPPAEKKKNNMVLIAAVVLIVALIIAVIAKNNK